MPGRGCLACPLTIEVDFALPEKNLAHPLVKTRHYQPSPSTAPFVPAYQGNRMKLFV
jgi:hypothetical protein